MKNEKLEHLVTFRLSESEYAPYKAILKQTKISRSKLFRSVFITKSALIEVPAPPRPELARLVFLASKTSNNINQIARKLNNAYSTGAISEKVFIETLNNLVSIERSFTSAVDKC
ncbi:MobC family plasmid mobilization relaxosome protein [Shewanella septentrionalis]|uniref:MobC family plasmid mobilization relaxosome protein n=1 Tax=Shewanella septentrionalis TaxID=2952223 RepID=A0A9X3B1K7_9GAMM|nr:MobC family plasmid mobilization relaxosome protein [Shewanella septentrionalis]MCT7947705.1 MobC family plasmid mobilization relaxosome protein [Shewanella septentrionalis]